MSIQKTLKSQTAELHKIVEEKMGSDKIFGSNFTVSDYSLLLRRLWFAHSTIEPAIENFNSIASLKDLEADIRFGKRALLEADILKAGFALPAEPEPCVFNSVEEAWGAFYVLEGSSLGGAAIYKQLKKHNWPVSFDYYSCYGDNTGKMWSDFRKILSLQVKPDQASIDKTLSGAKRAYRIFIGSSVSIMA